MTRKVQKPPNALIFIDTNIFLDFYRFPDAGGQAVPGFLEHIDKNRKWIITGNQVEMEYKKNRQKVIERSLVGINAPEVEREQEQRWQVPAFLRETLHTKEIEGARKEIVKARKEIKNQIAKLKERSRAVLSNPSKEDLIFQGLEKLFKSDEPYNLTRDNKHRDEIRRLAWERFVAGYPPRKDQDTSIGDAINWEWIIHCAKEAEKDVIVVSRDGDYGIPESETPNDWLAEEFKERVNRKLSLTNLLAEAFEQVNIPVTPEEKNLELELVDRTNSFQDMIAMSLAGWPNYKDLVGGLGEVELAKTQGLRAFTESLIESIGRAGGIEIFRIRSRDITEGAIGSGDKKEDSKK